MKSDSSIKRSVTTEQATKILADSGLNVTEKEAEEILDFLYFMCKLTVNQLVKNNDKVNSDPPNERAKLTKSRTKVIKP